MNTKRWAELFLTLGRISIVVGIALAAVPILLALPGLVLLVVGRSFYYIGEDLWNTHHRLPKRWGRQFAAGMCGVFADVGKSVE